MARIKEYDLLQIQGGCFARVIFKIECMLRYFRILKLMDQLFEK